MMSDDCKDFGTADLAMVGIVKWVLSSIWEVLGSPARETLAGFMHSYFCHRVGSVLIPKTVESRDLFMLSKLATQMSPKFRHVTTPIDSAGTSVLQDSKDEYPVVKPDSAGRKTQDLVSQYH
jgi:hypothetical protein